MSATIIKKVSELHDRLAEAVRPLKGRVVSKDDVHAVAVAAFAELDTNIDWIILSDHCRNRTNKGACNCAQTEYALFEWVQRGRYRVI